MVGSAKIRRGAKILDRALRVGAMAPAKPALHALV